MSLEWEVVRRRAENGDTLGVTSLLLKATEEERVAFAAEVETHIKALTPKDWWRPATDPTGGFALAVLGTMPSAPRAARLLLRRDIRDKWQQIPIPRLLEIVRGRELSWLGDLATRLAVRLSMDDTWTGGWKLVATLLAESGANPPVTEPVVRCWLDEMLRSPWERPPVPPIDKFRATPYLDLLLPALFEIDGLGAELNRGTMDPATNSWIDEPVFPAVTAQLVAEGRLDRKEILAATIDRLVRGGRPSSLRPFVMLHEALAPTLDESATHAVDYAGLLPDAPSTVAGLSQRALRTVDDAGLLDLETLLEVSRHTLLRKEKVLVKSQLSWLDKAARRTPARSPEILETIAVAFGHPALDIQERALTLTAQHLKRSADHLDTAALDRLAALARGLGGDLAARAAELFGTEEPTPVPGVIELLPSPAVAEMPPPITSAAELATEVAALLHEETAVRWERILAGLVTLHAAGETPALAAALTPLLTRHAEHFAEDHWQPRPRMSFLAAAIRRLADPTFDQAEKGRWHRLMATVNAPWTIGSPVLSEPPDRLLSLRVAELYVRILRSPVPELLATPTLVNGSLDATVLADRIRRFEAAGREPWPLDLEQALLRLPRDSDPAVAADLTSPAGRKMADWLTAGGLADPTSTRIEQAAGRKFEWHAGPEPDPVQPPAVARLSVNLTPTRAPLLRVEDQLVTLRRREVKHVFAHDQILNGSILTATLPHHREVLAAWALPDLSAGADEDQRGAGPLLPLLADCNGPIGPAMTLALAYGLAARHEPDRVAAVDAFLTLAARPDSDRPTTSEPPPHSAPTLATTASFATAVGRDLGDLGALGLIKLNRVVPALADAHRAGASTAVWQALATALPRLLAPAPRGLPDLLELATQVATATGTRAHLPQLPEAAKQKGNSRFAKEAKRLHSVLTR
ncbi:DUF6493 family protein [Paractinoplanes atraurantiacus]|uniref:Uncharacterized protein n=1 Tax=Paractinoplanes atraurantiacus TaxID=1036182 RepID=A0A285K540_9ACTN|nr:DUF6493 family protein [Actinoplanes atraurantiacus]SNY67699.1 hypothetical protein SAMN05421748_1327 [Actinoplanes atraurantiacus]